MKRLTKRDTDGQAMMDCEKCKADWTGKHGKPMVDCTALYCRNRLKDRIAAYEDSGCAPEEVLPKDKADEIALKLMRLADLESLCSYDRLRELAEADRSGVKRLPTAKRLLKCARRARSGKHRSSAISIALWITLTFLCPAWNWTSSTIAQKPLAGVMVRSLASSSVTGFMSLRPKRAVAATTSRAKISRRRILSRGNSALTSRICTVICTRQRATAGTLPICASTTRRAN
nr:MAG TPA: hypothetical protein [Caudoviricetes sp.]